MRVTPYMRGGSAGREAGAHLRAPRTRAERRDLAARERLAERVMAEFREMPCLRLTLEQAQRLFGLPPDVCARLMSSLESDGVLRLDADGRFAAAVQSR